MIASFRLTTIFILAKCVLSVYFQGCPEGYCAYTYLKTNSFPSNSTTIEYWSRASKAHFTAPETGIFGFASESGGNTTFSIVATQGNGELKVYVNGSSLSTSASGPELEWYHTSVSWESSTGELNVYIDGQLAANGNLCLGCQIPSTGTIAIGQLMVRILRCVFSFTTVTSCVLPNPHIFLFLRPGTSKH